MHEILGILEIVERLFFRPKRPFQPKILRDARDSMGTIEARHLHTPQAVHHCLRSSGILENV